MGQEVGVAGRVFLIVWSAGVVARDWFRGARHADLLMGMEGGDGIFVDIGPVSCARECRKGVCV